MRYHALAADYDGTIAHHGRVDPSTLEAIRKLKDSGRKLLLVTGREVNDLLAIFPDVAVFDRVVAENGAVLYCPAARKTRTLAEPPPTEFTTELARRGVERISVGHVIVATWEPHQDTVLETIRDLGLELQVIFNKGAVMVLPSGVNKATGLASALAELQLSPRNVVAIGDAENDHAFLAASECAVAVANALPALKERADLVTEAHHGAGVVELIDRLLADDLASVGPRLTRHHLHLGTDNEGNDLTFDIYGKSVIICGTSGSGKTTLTTGLLERLNQRGYQFAVIDPEGDYQDLEIAVELGSAQRPPDVDEIVEVLGEAQKNIVINLLGLAVDHRPAFLGELLPHLLEMRSRTGRPHWVLVDEAHHLLPEAWKPSNLTLPADLGGTLFITVHPESLSDAVRRSIDIVIAVGRDPARTIAAFCEAVDEKCPKVPKIEQLTRGEVIYWKRGEKVAQLVRTPPPQSERKRHSRKYAEGNLGPDDSFYFRGPQGTLNLKAHNLFLFLQIADGVDDLTWEFHRRNGDYSRWMGAEGVKDEQLEQEVARIEQDHRLDARASRAAVRKAVEARYTLPADRKSGKI